MGGSSSKAPIAAEKAQQIIEESSGTHFLEIHLPSVGFSGAILLFFVLLLCVVVAAFRSCRRSNRPPAYSPAPPIQPYAPFFPPPWTSQPGTFPMGLSQSPAHFLHALEAGLPLPRHLPERRVPSLDRFQELDEGTLPRHSGRSQRPPGQAPEHQGPAHEQSSFSALAGRFAPTAADTTRD